MSTYASRTDVENYIEGWTTDDPFALERMIQRAEGDLERVLSRSSFSPPTQVISLTGASGGTFMVHWNGSHPQSTPAEAFNVSAAQLQTDLQVLTDIGLGNVTVLGSNPYTLVWTYAWSQYYPNQVIPLVTVDGSNLQPSVAAASVALVKGRKINPLTDLDANQKVALINATCAQVEYRSAMGERFFVRAQYESIKGPDFSTMGKMPMIAPKAKRELAQTGLLMVGGRAFASYRRRGLGRGEATY